MTGGGGGEPLPDRSPQWLDTQGQAEAKTLCGTSGGDDIAEFSKFYIENVPRLVAFLICQGASPVDAADCVHEALIEALPPKWGAVEHPYAWCRTVAFRKLCALFRKSVLTVSEPELSGSPLITSDSGTDLIEHHQEFLYWLQQLRGERQRAVLVCAYDGATAAETAELLGMNPASVRSTLRQARQALRQVRDRAKGGEPT